MDDPSYNLLVVWCVNIANNAYSRKLSRWEINAFANWTIRLTFWANGEKRWNIVQLYGVRTRNGTNI